MDLLELLRKGGMDGDVTSYGRPESAGRGDHGAEVSARTVLSMENAA